MLFTLSIDRYESLNEIQGFKPYRTSARKQRRLKKGSPLWQSNPPLSTGKKHFFVFYYDLKISKGKCGLYKQWFLKI
jgi:hypothetical protein